MPEHIVIRLPEGNAGQNQESTDSEINEFRASYRADMRYEKIGVGIVIALVVLALLSAMFSDFICPALQTWLQ